MKQKVLNTIAIVGVVVFLWLAWSFIDIVDDNNSCQPEHSDVNAFVTLVD